MSSRRSEDVNHGATRAALQALSFCARLALWDIAEDIDESHGDESHSDFRFTIQRGDYTYRAQLLCYDDNDFALLFLYPDVLCDEDEAPVACELASRLNCSVVVGSFCVNPSQSSGIFFRTWRWLDPKEEETRAVKALLNSCDYSLTVFEQAYKYWQEWGISVEDAVMTGGL